MKVRDLIKQLQKLPQDKDIVITSMDDKFYCDDFELHSFEDSDIETEIILPYYFDSYTKEKDAFSESRNLRRKSERLSRILRRKPERLSRILRRNEGKETITFKLGKADVEVTNDTNETFTAEEISKVIQNENPQIWWSDADCYHYIMDFSFVKNGKKYWIESKHIEGDFSKFELNIYEGINESCRKPLRKIGRKLERLSRILRRNESKKYLTKKELIAKVKEGILPDEYVPFDIGQGFGYKIDKKWEEIPSDDVVIYIPEDGYDIDDNENEFPVEDSIYTKADFREITKEAGDKSESYAKQIFIEVDWTYPETLWDELDIDYENESRKIRRSPLLKRLKEKKSVKIDVENPGVLEVPEGKKFWQLPLSHFEKLVDKKGYAKVIRALTNLEVWNKNDDPEISKKASDIADKLKKKFKKESFIRRNEKEKWQTSPTSKCFYDFVKVLAKKLHVEPGEYFKINAKEMPMEVNFDFDDKKVRIEYFSEHIDAEKHVMVYVDDTDVRAFEFKPCEKEQLDKVTDRVMNFIKSV